VDERRPLAREMLLAQFSLGRCRIRCSTSAHPLAPASKTAGAGIASRRRTRQSSSLPDRAERLRTPSRGRTSCRNSYGSFIVRRAKACIFSGCESGPQRSFQPVAVGATMEVTQSSKPWRQRVAAGIGAGAAHVRLRKKFRGGGRSWGSTHSHQPQKQPELGLPRGAVRGKAAPCRTVLSG